MALALGFALANCGGTDQAVSQATSVPTATAVASAPTPSAKQSGSETALASKPEASNESGSGPGVARTFQQERERLRLLASRQKTKIKNGQKAKKQGFFSSLLSTSNKRSGPAKYRRNGNNIKSMKPFWGRFGGKRRR